MYRLQYSVLQYCNRRPYCTDVTCDVPVPGPVFNTAIPVCHNIAYMLLQYTCVLNMAILKCNIAIDYTCPGCLLEYTCTYTCTYPCTYSSIGSIYMLACYFLIVVGVPCFRYCNKAFFHDWKKVPITRVTRVLYTRVHVYGIFNTRVLNTCTEYYYWVVGTRVHYCMVPAIE